VDSIKSCIASRRIRPPHNLLTRQTNSDAGILQLRFHSAVFDHVSARGYHVHDGKEGVVFQEDCDLLSDLHPVAVLPSVFLGVVAATQFPGLNPWRIGRCDPALAHGEHRNIARWRARRGNHGVRDGVG
jgi:hypothetical protein